MLVVKVQRNDEPAAALTSHVTLTILKDLCSREAELFQEPMIGQRGSALRIRMTNLNYSNIWAVVARTLYDHFDALPLRPTSLTMVYPDSRPSSFRPKHRIGSARLTPFSFMLVAAELRR
jgi:hypothetical protein